MRRYNSSVEAASETVREVFSRGLTAFDSTVQGKLVDPSEYQMKELIGYTFTLTSQAHQDKLEMLEWARKNFNRPHICQEYGEHWFKATVAGLPEMEIQGHSIYYPEYWSKFGEKVYSYTYADRLSESLKKAVELLKINPYRRGVILQVYHPIDLERLYFNKRVPCSIEYHPLIRKTVFGDVLILIYHSRSMDLVNWFALDLYRSMRLQEYLAEQLNISVGDMIVYIDSLHAYICDVPSDLRW